MIPKNSAHKFVEMYDSPWLQKQVKSHLFWGEYEGKHYFLLAILAYSVICVFLFSSLSEVKSTFPYNEPHTGIIVVLIMGILFGNYKTNAILWAVVKVTLLFAAFISILMGAINLLRHDPADVELIILGLTWLPSLEFITGITEKQKYLTLARVIVTVPLILIL